jgi:hypothetical protein
MSDYFVKKAAWRCQRATAARRGISFEMPFQVWTAWWEKQLGPDWFQKRGKRRGQYVMARKGDKGPYKIGNISCLKTEDNVSQMKRSPEMFSATPPDVIRQIYESDGCMAEISQRFKVKYTTVYDIRSDRSWTKLTKEMDRGSKCPCPNGVPCEKGFKRYP